LNQFSRANASGFVQEVEAKNREIKTAKIFPAGSEGQPDEWRGGLSDTMRGVPP